MQASGGNGDGVCNLLFTAPEKKQVGEIIDHPRNPQRPRTLKTAFGPLKSLLNNGS